MLPYFAAGLALSEFGIDALKYSRACILCAVVFILVVLFEGDIHVNGMGFYWVSVYWRDVIGDWRNIMCFFARPVVGLTGTIAFLWVIRIISNRVIGFRRLARFGQTTLGVYVIHEWIVIRASEHLDMAYPFVCKWIFAVVLFLVCHMVVVGIKRVKCLDAVMFSDEDWIAGKFTQVQNSIISLLVR